MALEQKPQRWKIGNTEFLGDNKSVKDAVNIWYDYANVLNIQPEALLSGMKVQFATDKESAENLEFNSQNAGGALGTAMQSRTEGETYNSRMNIFMNPNLTLPQKEHVFSHEVGGHGIWRALTGVNKDGTKIPNFMRHPSIFNSYNERLSGEPPKQTREDWKSNWLDTRKDSLSGLDFLSAANPTEEERYSLMRIPLKDMFLNHPYNQQREDLKENMADFWSYAMASGRADLLYEKGKGQNEKKYYEDQRDKYNKDNPWYKYIKPWDSSNAQQAPFEDSKYYTKSEAYLKSEPEAIARMWDLLYADRKNFVDDPLAPQNQLPHLYPGYTSFNNMIDNIRVSDRNILH